jgi:RNA polymerase sigma-70 factor (ECF subfamily)
MDELIRGLKAGRPESFERLVREFGDRIYRFVKRLAGERQAEDLTQEVFLRVHRSIDAYRPEGRFESWLFAIAGNLCIDHSRRRKPEASLSELDEDLSPERFASPGREPIEAAEEDERRRALLKAVERLPFEQKQVFLLREEAGLSFKEIAEMTGCPLNTALGRMHYAMESLRKSLKAYGMQ